MKRIIFSLVAFGCITCMQAQTSGTIHYTETRKLHFNIQGDAPPPPNLPTENNLNTVLYYNAEASLYQNDSAQTEEGNMNEEDGDGNHMTMRMSLPDNKVYCDFKNNKMIRQQDFMQRKFIVESDLNSEGWKLTGQQKMILNYPCQQATKDVDSTQHVVAWFTPAIPVSIGPGMYCGLPGLVLEVDINDGEQIITAKAIKNTVDSEMIQKPKDGKKVTDEEYKKIVADKMKEMGIDNPGGGGTIMIRINDN